MKRRRSRILRLAPVDRRVYGPPILRLLLQDVNTGVLWQLETFAPFLSQSLCAGKKRGGRQTFEDIGGGEGGGGWGDLGGFFGVILEFSYPPEAVPVIAAPLKTHPD